MKFLCLQSCLLPSAGHKREVHEKILSAVINEMKNLKVSDIPRKDYVYYIVIETKKKKILNLLPLFFFFFFNITQVFSLNYYSEHDLNEHISSFWSIFLVSGVRIDVND